jgi:hypothetical protein
VTERGIHRFDFRDEMECVKMEKHLQPLAAVVIITARDSINGGSPMVRTRMIMMIAVVLALAESGAIAQVRVPRTQVESKVPVTIALQIGTESYKYTGQGTCRHATVASIYDMPAEQWTMEASDGPRSVTLTLWRPKKGGSDMVSFAASTAGKEHVVDTVKVGDRGSVQGSGSATLVPAGKGGTFTIEAIAADGAKINGTIKCDAFSAREAVAGD